MFPQELARRKSCDALEKPREMVREVEPQQARSLADIVALHQQTLGLIDDIVVYVANGRPSRSLSDDVAKIAWRVCKLRGTPCDGGQALRELAVLAEIGLQEVVKLLQQVAAPLVLF